MHPIIQSLKERKLVQWGLAYLAGAVAVYQVLDAFAEPWGVTDGFLRAVQLLLAVGFFIALVLAWYHGESGRQGVSGPELIILTGILLLGVVGLGFLQGANVRPDGGDTETFRVNAGPGTIAVLPFEHLSVDAERAVFTDGFHEELIIKLNEIRGLTVISRTSVMEYRVGARNLPEIAARLGVRNIVEGSARWAGETVRIGVRLVDAGTDRGLWNETFDGDVSLDNLFDTQTDVATQIASALRVQFSPEESVRLESRPTENFEAYRLYQVGRSHFNTRTGEGLTRALGFYRQAVELDPGYALAHVGSADALAMLVVYGWLPTREGMADAKLAARTALEIDRDNGQAHTALAETVWLGDWDWATAEAEMEAGRRLAPRYAQAHHWHSYFLAARGDHEGALTAIQEALTLDPLSLIVNTWAAVIHRHGRRSADAIRQFELTLELDDEFPLAHAHLGLTYSTLGRFDEALYHLETAAGLDPNATRILGMLGHAYGLAGREDDAMRVIDQLESLRSQRHVSSYDIGLVYLGMSDADAAFAAFDQAASERDTLMLLIGQEPAFDAWVDDPRFQALLDQLGVPPLPA